MDDLWTASANNQTLDLSTEHGRSTRAQRLSERAVVSHLRAWLLDDYTAAYCRALAATRIFRRCYWIDALGTTARANKVEQNGQGDDTAQALPPKKRARSELPPVLQPVAALAQTLAQESKPLALRGLLLTAGSSRRKEPRPATEQLNGSSILPKESGLLAASWLEIAPMLLKEIEQSPAIFLLNPLGATTFSYDDLAPLYQRAVPTELCLLITHKQVSALLHAAQRSPERATQLTSLLRSDRWKALPIEEEQLEQAVEGWLELLSASMQRHFLFPVQRIAIQAQVAPASVEALPYTLLFATRRQDSLLCMNDAVHTYQQRLREQSWRGVLSEAWFFQQDALRHQENLEQLEQRLLQQGRATRSRRWPDLRQQLMLDQFGQFTRQEYDTLIRQLLVDGEVRCMWQRGTSEQPDERIPGNNDALLWR